LLARAREFWRGRTLICVTHDVAETRAFDRVLVVDRGRIIEDDTPAVLGRDGRSRYAQLVKAETNIRAGLWNGAFWRRVRVHGGTIVEELPKRTEEGQRGIEVA
jgi:ATP-binding cassette subfamily B protein